MQYTDKIPIGTLSDGTILIFVEPEYLNELNFFINEKSHDLYLYLIEKDGETIMKQYGKHKFNYNQTAQDLY
jgi:hypothetical protein